VEASVALTMHLSSDNQTYGRVNIRTRHDR
jgi:hypothetical protein